MEYGKKIYGGDCGPIAPAVVNDSFIKHVGYEESNLCIKKYYSQNTIDTISHKITQLLQGVDPKNRRIIVPDKTISSIMNAVKSDYRPPIGDIHSRYIVPSGINSESYVQNMIDEVIEIITSDVRNNVGMEEANSKLSIWTTVYGDFNKHGLQAHAPIKIRNKRPTPMQFNMNY